MNAPLPPNETDRLAALRAYEILDTCPEEAYDDITLIASLITNVPIALVSLVDEKRQWFKSRLGVDVAETPRDLAFCGHAILTPEEPLIITDATQDQRFASNPLVLSDPKIRFYAGAPIVTTNGEALGTLCVIDRKPRSISRKETNALQALARQVMAQLELRHSVAKLGKAAVVQERYRQQLEAYQQKLESANELLYHQTLTDALTGIMNRRAFDFRLQEEMERALRYETSLSLVMVDVDAFKPYNDEFGHPAGDEVLKKLARVLENNSRQSDVVARFGGEEFVIILPTTDRESAFILAERFRRAIEGTEWKHRPVTISAGVATLSNKVSDCPSLITAADQQLYQSKETGGNCVCQAA